VARLTAIVELMKDIERRSQCEDILSKVQDICAHNQRWFFSAEFHNRVVGEYQANLNQAVDIMAQHANGTFWKAHMRDRANLGDLRETREDVVKIWRWLQDQKKQKM
jgi:DNA mismatch repair ATPase MutS